MKKILIVEDDPILRNNITDILTIENYYVITAKHGKEGLLKAKKYLPDLIISDIMMPEMDGYELINNIQKDEDLADIPFIFLTAKGDPLEFRKGMNIGADDFLTKPFNIDELLHVIKKRLEKKEFYDKKNEKIKEALIRRIPHELRTPLSGILGFSEYMEDNIQNLSLDEIKDMISKIKTSGIRISNRVQKFLLYSELLSGELTKYYNKSDEPIKTYFDKFFVSSLIFSFVKEKDKIGKIVIDVQSVDIKINKNMLTLIIKELIENALKYSDPQEKINIHGRYTLNNYRISVINKINENDKIISTKIEALKNLTENNYMYEGIGLGLSIVKKIIEDCDGLLTMNVNENIVNVSVELKLCEI